LKGLVKTLHLDVVDGKFAPNKTFQFSFKLSHNFTYHAHLMIKRPEKWIHKNFKRIELFIPQFEEIRNHLEYISWMKNKKRKVAFALLPETKIQQIKPFLSQINYLLILTVHPGFYGGKYLKSELKKIPRIKKINPRIKIIVDGGMNPQTIKQAKKAGADFFVSGSYTTKALYPQQRIKKLLKALK
ncbi:MAG TPA: hypothetical protein ENL27_02850, partial [Candidatus Parcubacteria bacterium]|nr:hypothetical protein [Candidatus Parcubacteria bacterium]